MVNTHSIFNTILGTPVPNQCRVRALIEKFGEIGSVEAYLPTDQFSSRFPSTLVPNRHRVRALIIKFGETGSV